MENNIEVADKGEIEIAVTIPPQLRPQTNNVDPPPTTETTRTTDRTQPAAPNILDTKYTINNNDG